MRHTDTPRRSRRILRSLLGTVTAVAIAATLAATATASPAAAAEPWLKPVLGGLLDRHNPPPSGFRGTVDGFVAEVAWSDLQLTPGGPIVADNPIDKDLAVAKAQGLKIKLRVLAGTSAPDWAKRLDGPPVAVVDEYGNTGTIGRFWTQRFADAYLDLQRKLAARYDNAPQILMTQITRCTTMFAEPFLRQARTPESVQSLLKAGYTAALDEACHRAQVDAHKVWVHTRSGLSFNPYQRIYADGSSTNDIAFTQQMMGYCRTALAARCVLENHSIRTADQGPLYDQLYAAMKALGGPIGFQTATPDKIGDLSGTLAWAVQQGAAHVELPISYKTDATPTALLTYNNQLNTIASSQSFATTMS
jgi:hypothetical protein